MTDDHGDLDEGMTDEDLAARAKEVLGIAVAAAPPAPSIADVESRIAARNGGAVAAPEPVPGSSVSTSNDPAGGNEDDVLADYVTTERRAAGRTQPGSRWPRLVLAAAIVAVVGIGVTMAGRGDDEPVDRAQGSEGVGDVVGVLPTEPPEGMVLSWIGHHADGAGEGTALQYARTDGPESLMITATVFNQQPHPTDGTSTTVVVGTGVVADQDVVDESVNVRMGDKEVLLTDEGRTARFVGPVGMAVEVTGEPDDVAAVVPTLETVDAARWREFEEQVSADVEALERVAEADLIRNDLASGLLAFPEVTTGPTDVAISIHADPATGTGNAAGDPPPSGVAAGTCLTVSESTVCRPGSPLDHDVPGGTEDTNDVLIEGRWWHFGWSTNQLTEVSVTHDADFMDGSTEARWLYEGSGQGTALSWYVSALPPEATRLEAQLSYADTATSGFTQLRPAS